jgi:hypothetical protein
LYFYVDHYENPPAIFDDTFGWDADPGLRQTQLQKVWNIISSWIANKNSFKKSKEGIRKTMTGGEESDEKDGRQIVTMRQQ